MVDLAKASEREQLSVVWNWAGHFGFPQRKLRVFCGYAVHAGCVRFGNRSKWSVLLLRVVMHDAMTEVFSLNPEVRARMYLDDTRLLRREELLWMLTSKVESKLC